MDNEMILQRIEELNREAGWSFYKLSKKSGIPQSTLSSIFSTRSNISLANLNKICQAHGISLAIFFTDLEKRISGDKNMEAAEEFHTLNDRDRRLLNTMMKTMRELDREKREYGGKKE